MTSGLVYRKWSWFREVQLLAVLVLLLLARDSRMWAAGEGGTPPVVLGLMLNEALQKDTEFQRFGRMIPVYKQNGIQASLCENSNLINAGASEEGIYQQLKAFHVVRLQTSTEGFYDLTPELKSHAKVVGAALARYVRDGGGLLLQSVAVRYPNSFDEQYWNLVCEPLGLQILHEGVYDPTRHFEGNAITKVNFWITRSFKEHAVTAGIKTLCLPQSWLTEMPALLALKYTPDWTVVVQGEKEARSYLTGVDNINHFDKPGTMTEAPPVLAVRELGKGRIVSLPLPTCHTGDNHLNPVWASVFETEGDKQGGVPSDGMKLVINSIKWLAVPAQQNPAMGTTKIPPYAPVQFPPTVNWDTDKFQPVVNVAIRGIFGLHSTFSDGKGTVAQYVAAAQAAGLSFVVFTDPLELLTPEKLTTLKADCAAVNKQKAGAFYACPGIEFTDGIGNRWVTWGEKVQWPEATFKDKIWTYTQWDGSRVRFYGKYMEQNGYAGIALLDYKQLRANGAHPENLWWFYHYIPLAYEGTKLIADNRGDYLFGLRDLRMAIPVSFTRIRTPAEVAAAAQTCHTGFRTIPLARTALNTRCCDPFYAIQQNGQYVGQGGGGGPQIRAWDCSNNQMESHWGFTRGAQRVRLRFSVHADDGIAEVLIHDTDRGPIRRFLASGVKDLTREFEMIHDKEHVLVMEVIDTQGRKALSSPHRVYSYKQGLDRCGDNLNILGASSMCWIPDRNDMCSLARYFNNGAEYSLEGTDSAGPVCPTPQATGWTKMTFQGVGDYPKETVSNLMDVRLSSYNVQIVTMRMQNLSETWDNAQRPGPAFCTVPKDLGELEYFERTHTLYSPADRADFYVIWNHRRTREGTADYRGALNWHEGEIRFKKDVVLQGAVPIPLAYMRCPVDLERRWGNVIVATEADNHTKVGLIRQPKPATYFEGRLRPGGYIAQMPTLLGYEAFLTPADSDYAYASYTQDQYSTITVGLGRDGQAIKAGTVLKYRFAYATIADPQGGTEVLEDTVKCFNLGGGSNGYGIQMKVGEPVDTIFFFTAAAKANEALFTLGPRATMIDLPLRVQGLEDNGCAAVYSSRRPWYRFVSVAKDTAYFQEAIESTNTIWAGNLFVCDNKSVKLSVVIDGQAPGAAPFIEVHNLTDKPITSTLRAPEHAPLYGGTTGEVTVSAGSTVRLIIAGKQLKAP